MTFASLLLVIALLLVGLPILGIIFLKIMKQMVDRTDAKAHELDKEEAKILTDLNSGMKRMEERIEALETILINRRD